MTEQEHRDDRAVNELVEVVKQQIQLVREQDKDVARLTRTTDKLELMTEDLKREVAKVGRIFEGDESPTSKIIRIEEQLRSMRDSGTDRDKRIELHWKVMWGVAAGLIIEVVHTLFTHFGK